MAGLSQLLEGFRKAAEDLMHVDVVTLTGEITLDGTNVKDGAGEGSGGRRIDTPSIYDKIVGAATGASTGARIEVVAFTRIEPDLDNVYFVKKGLTEAEGELLASHAQMVQAAGEGRVAFLKMIRDLGFL
jgi:uncharacterized spore protein YtfJ